MSDVLIRKEGQAGRITLNRPEALNALTYEMVLAIDAALDDWAADDAVSLVFIEGAGERAFCAGGDLAEMYRTGTAGDYGYGQRFWRDEYRLNAKIGGYEKPFIAFMHGFTMGGGVGVSAHARIRVVGESTAIAMPECAVGLVPDVGGTHLLGQAPGALGVYLGMTGTRMGPADAIHAGFGDVFVPEAHWEGLKARLVQTGVAGVVEDFREEAGAAPLAAEAEVIDRVFGAGDHLAILAALETETGEWGDKARKALGRQAPLSAAVTAALVPMARAAGTLEAALELEYRFTSRSMEHGDFLEGIRALIIDKDKTPKWRHATIGDVTREEVSFLLSAAEPVFA